MGTRIVRWAGLLMCGAGLLFAAPVLRLSQTVAGMGYLGPGYPPPSTNIYAYNAGDGALSVGVSVPPGVTWLAASVTGPCSGSSLLGCVLIQFSVTTAGLSLEQLTNGTWSAGVTVYAPGAVDSPQTVIVTLAGEFGVNSYLTAGTTCDIPVGGCPLVGSSSTSTEDGGTWLTLVSGGVSLSTLPCSGRTYLVHLAPPANMVPGGYVGAASGNVGVYGGSVPVLMQIVPQPLAVPAPSQIDLTLAQGGPPMAYPFVPAISLNPAGTIAATSAAASGTGIGASVSGGLVLVTVDPGGLAAGSYSGSVTIGCNPVNCPVVVPVNLTIAGPSPPAIGTGVFDNVTFSAGAVAPGEVLVVQGQQLSAEAPVIAQGAALPTTLGGVSVLVNGSAAPLYYSSANQVAFQLPGGTAAGTATVQVKSGGQASGTVQVNVQPYAGQIAAITDTAYHLLDGYHPAHRGETIVLWAIGLGATNPAVADGTAGPANPPVMTVATPMVEFGLNTMATPDFTGLSSGAVGLYQVNVAIPATVAGNIFVKLVAGNWTSNAAPLTVE